MIKFSSQKPPVARKLQGLLILINSSSIFKLVIWHSFQSLSFLNILDPVTFIQTYVMFVNTTKLSFWEFSLFEGNSPWR